MISSLTTEAIVFEPPQMKIAPNGNEYLALGLGLFDIKETGAQSFTKLECTLWSNPNLAKRIMEMNLEPRDRVLVAGKFTIKKVHSRPKLRLYIYELTLLSKTTSSTKNNAYNPENIDYSILIDDVEVFNTEPVVLRDYEDVGGRAVEMDSEDF